MIVARFVITQEAFDIALENLRHIPFSDEEIYCRGCVMAYVAAQANLGRIWVDEKGINLNGVLYLADERCDAIIACFDDAHRCQDKPELAGRVKSEISMLNLPVEVTLHKYDNSIHEMRGVEL